ncbi:MAG TPA: hypothetical protein VNM16_11945 [Bacillota bacterium]|nr:hypothetical protein [Bacillota bacterium]
MAVLIVGVLVVAASVAGVGRAGTNTAGTATGSGTSLGAATATGTAAAGAGAGYGVAPATASATATATATGTASDAVAAGPLAAVDQYFAALRAGSYASAYALLAPAWRSAHSLATFVSGVPPQAPQLTGSTVTSVANFQATVSITLVPVGGSPKTEDVQLTDVNQAATGSAATHWLLAAPPVGAGG